MDIGKENNRYHTIHLRVYINIPQIFYLFWYVRMENGLFRETPQNQSDNNYFNNICRYLNTENNVTNNTKYTLHGFFIYFKKVLAHDTVDFDRQLNIHKISDLV